MVDFSVKKVCANSIPEQSAVKDDAEKFSGKQNAQRPDGTMSRQCAMAARAYTLIDNFQERPVSLKDYTKKLKQHHIDFDIDSSHGKNIHLNIKNKRGQTVKTLHYDGGTDEKNLTRYEVMYYNDNSKIPCKEKGFDIKSTRPNWINNIYKNIPQEKFIPVGLNINTGIEDYTAFLKSRGREEGKDFVIKNDIDSDGYTEKNIVEFDKNGKKFRNTRWCPQNGRYGFNNQAYYDKDGFLYRSITFDNDGSTSVCDYYDKEIRKLHDML